MELMIIKGEGGHSFWLSAGRGRTTCREAHSTDIDTFLKANVGARVKCKSATLLFSSSLSGDRILTYSTLEEP